MTAALGLAEQGYHTYLVEQSGELGGNALMLNETWRGDKISHAVQAMIQHRYENHPEIDVYLECRHQGGFRFCGQFRDHHIPKRFRRHDSWCMGPWWWRVGSEEYKPTEYLYGDDDRVLSHLEFDAALMADDDACEKGRFRRVYSVRGLQGAG